jgi:phosphoribosylglycinamide formyltransferase-1
MYRFGWFSSGRDEAARELLRVAHDNITAGNIDAELSFVFSSREPGEYPGSDLFLKDVEGYGIPLVCYSYQKFRAGRDNGKGTLPDWRLEYDRQVMSRLWRFRPDVCVLAGYMLIAGREMCRKYDMINLHPAAPGGPAGTWQEVIWQLIRTGAASTGVMMHLVTPEMDKGPVVTYCTFPIRGGRFDSLWQNMKGKDIEEIMKSQGEDNALFKLIREEGFKREIPLILTTMKAFSQGRVRIAAGNVVDSCGKPLPGCDLTAEIDECVR